MSDDALRDSIEAARNGDKEAFREIFNRLHGRLYAYARSHVSDKSEAQDIVQDTMIGLWEALPGFEYRSPESFYAFSFMILKRTIMRVYGKAKRAPVSLERMMEESGDTLTPATHPEYEDYRTLLKTIDGLSEGAREVLTLRYWPELTFQEIADTLEITESAAKVRHHRAMNEMREILTTYGYGKT